MLLYLSASENEKLFADYCGQRDMYLDFIDMDQEHSLKTAISKNRNMPNYKFVLFHFTKTPVPEADLCEAVSFIKKFHHARVIVFAPQDAQTTKVFAALVRMALHELVAVSGDTDLFAELEKCLSYEGKGFSHSTQIAATAHIETVRSYIRPRLEIPEGFSLTVGLAGAQGRVGVTTQAFSLYHALEALGFSPCIVDTAQAFIGALMKLFPEETGICGSVVSIRGMDFTHAVQVGTGHNVFIFDCGRLEEENIQIFQACGLRLLCTGAKAWEFPELAKTLRAYPHAAQHLILSFVSPKEERQIQPLLAGLPPAAFAPWNPDIWEETNKEWHEKFLIPILKELVAL